jgi:hypothetical protein
MKQPVKRQAQEPDNVPIIDIKLLDELINDRVLSGEQITGIASSLIRSRQTQGTPNMSSLPYVVKAGGYGGESLPARFTFLEAVACCCCYQLELELERRAEKFHITLTDLIEALKQVFRNGPNVFFYYCQSDDDGEFILNQAELYARLQDAMDKMSPFLSVPLLPVIQAAWAVSKQYYPALATFEFKSSEGTPAWIKKDAALRQFNIGWRRLEQWRMDGFVRSVKLGEGQSSARLYMGSDINDVLLALAAGRKPVVKQGRVK